MKQNLNQRASEDELKGYIKFEGKIWHIDMTGKEWIFDIVEPDGTRRPATREDGDLMKAMNYGQSIPDPTIKEEKQINKKA